MKTSDKLPPSLAAIAHELQNSSSFFLAVHQNPDGDTLGCALCLQSVLERQGKTAFVFSTDPLPKYLSFLQGYDRVSVGVLPQGKHFDTAVMLECSNPKRAGDVSSVLAGVRCVINIDHHVTSDNYGHINHVDATASSISEIVFGMLDAMGVTLTPAEADCLYVGLATDTGRFHYKAATPLTHRTAARLIESGAKAWEINDRVYATKDFASLKLLGLALTRLELLHGGKTGVSYITTEDFKKYSATHQNTEDIVNYGLMPGGVKVSALFKEENGRITVNFRSRGEMDVSAVAKDFGGGGHKNASGCKSTLPLEEIKRLVLARIEKLY